MSTPDRSEEAPNDGALDPLTPAFEKTYAAHAEEVLRYFARRTGCPETAADLTAETFSAALIGWHGFDGRSSARTWLFGIAHHQLSRYLRRRSVDARARRKLGLSRPDLDDDSVERTVALIDSEQAWRELQPLIESLPTGERDAVRLRFGEEQSYDAIAETLHCTPGAARVRVSRALTKLRGTGPEPPETQEAKR